MRDGDDVLQSCTGVKKAFFVKQYTRTRCLVAYTQRTLCVALPLRVGLAVRPNEPTRGQPPDATGHKSPLLLYPTH